MRQTGSKNTGNAQRIRSNSVSLIFYESTDITRPIMALIAGIQAPPGRVMGHAGAFIGAGEKKAIGKVTALEDAGVVITNHPSKFGEEMKRLLGSEAYRTSSVSDIPD